MPNEVKMYFLGYYGRPPAQVDPEIAVKVVGDEEPITCRPGEILEPGLEEAREAIKPWILQPEDVLTYALFPNVARGFLVRKFARTLKRDVGFEEPVEGVAYPV